MNRGKIVIITMMVVAIGLAIFAWWNRYSQSQKVLEVWGADVVLAIRTGDRAHLLQLQSLANRAAAENEDRIDVLKNGEKTTLVVVNQQEITDVPGLIHARHHLVHRMGFDWDAPRSATCEPTWPLALRFHEPGTATMLLDFDCKRVYLLERDVEVAMRPIIADALFEFIEESNLQP